jgi:hypothetical protein
MADLVTGSDILMYIGLAALAGRSEFRLRSGHRNDNANIAPPYKILYFMLYSSVLRRCNLKLIGYAFFSTRCRCFGLQVLFLLFRPHQPSKRNFAIPHKDFYVAAVHGETLIAMYRFSDFLRECAVRRSHLLLICSRGSLELAFPRAVWTLLDFLIPQDWGGQKRYAKRQQTQRQKQSRQFKRNSVHFYLSS